MWRAFAPEQTRALSNRCAYTTIRLNAGLGVKRQFANLAWLAPVGQKPPLDIPQHA